MTKKVRRWSGEDIKILKDLAQKLPAANIAARLGRSPAALAVKAHELRVSLRVNGQAERKPLSAGDPQPVGSI